MDSFVILIGFLAYFLGKVKVLLILYTAVMLHEAGHFAACRILGEEVSELRLMPYGFNLRTRAVANPAHSVIIALSGPAASLLLMCLFRGFSSPAAKAFTASNAAVFALNMFPALPLDGGGALKGLLTYRHGYIYAHRKSIEITRIVGVLFAFFGIIFLILSKYNISLLVISGFLLYNLKEERKNILFLRQMIYSKAFDRSGKLLRIKHRAVTRDVSALSLTDCFGYNFICHFFVYDGNMKLLGTLTQSEVIDGIEALGAGATAGELIRRSI